MDSLILYIQWLSYLKIIFIICFASTYVVSETLPQVNNLQVTVQPNGELSLQWQWPGPVGPNCIDFQIEYKISRISKSWKNVTTGSNQVMLPGSHVKWMNKFRMRAVGVCYNASTYGNWSYGSFSAKTAVPQNLSISAVGNLTKLRVDWGSSEILNISSCIEFQMDYGHNPKHSNAWQKTYQKDTFFESHFDGNLQLDVRVRTKFECLKRVHSKWSPTVTRLPPHGANGTTAHGIACILHNGLFMECSWKRGLAVSNDTRYRLYYWHIDKPYPEECPNYFWKDGSEQACRFEQGEVPLHADFTLFINGTNAKVKSTFSKPIITVRPYAPENLTVTCTDGVAFTSWHAPPGGFWKNKMDQLQYMLETRQAKNENWTEWESKKPELQIEGLDKRREYVFRTRAKVVRQGDWSTWSGEARCGLSTTKDILSTEGTIVLAFASALCVALSLVVYNRRRITSRVLPPIPDPKHSFQHLFSAYKGSMQIRTGNECNNRNSKWPQKQDVEGAFTAVSIISETEQCLPSGYVNLDGTNTEMLLCSQVGHVTMTTNQSLLLRM
uniref:interleukin-13 receptor subunit alpha-2-like isoform X2 n=1 Tax=Myxine glutinosa TaxID=7769 RepID=UPI00358E1736